MERMARNARMVEMRRRGAEGGHFLQHCQKMLGLSQILGSGPT